MIFFVAFLCFLALLWSVFLDGYVNLVFYPYYSGTYTYMQIVAVSSICLLTSMIFIRMFKKLIFGPLNLYDKYKTNKQQKVSLKALEAYFLSIGNNSYDSNIFDQYAKTLSNNPFYFLTAFLLNKHTNNDIKQLSSELSNKICIAIQNYPCGDFLALYTKVNTLFDEKHYDSALVLLESADSFAYKTFWFWDKMFYCYLETKDFDKAEKATKNLYQHIDKNNNDKKAEYEIALAHKKAQNNIDKTSNLEYCYKLDCKYAYEYVEHLLTIDQKEKAEKIIRQVWKNKPEMKIGFLMDKVFADLVPVERFAAISDIIKQNPDLIESKFFLARGALEAGLFMMSRELLMQVAINHPQLAFPLLAKLEVLEKNDYKEGNKWLERALQQS